MTPSNPSSSILIKNCGLLTDGDITVAVETNADYIGFIHYPPSPRHISTQEAAALSALAPNTKIVSVMVNPDNALLTEITTHYTPHMFQLHGSESPDLCAEIKAQYGIPIMKAIAVTHAEDILQWEAYRNIADWILFDAKTPKNALPGGMGISFDWSLLRALNISLPWMLSGGLNVNNIEDAIHITNAQAVDISSGIELQPGKKDANKIREFNTRVKQYEH